ncbi:hypothetical protein ACHAWF_000890 [Thalassiosira exigua]
MARSYLPLIALFAILGAAAGFFKAAVPHQETATPKANAASASSTLSATFDDGLDNPDVVSDMNIHPARKCGFCMGAWASNPSQPSGGHGFEVKVKIKLG